MVPNVGKHLDAGKQGPSLQRRSVRVPGGGIIASNPMKYKDICE
jgi:hypothetical protein